MRVYGRFQYDDTLTMMLILKVRIGWYFQYDVTQEKKNVLLFLKAILSPQIIAPLNYRHVKI